MKEYIFIFLISTTFSYLTFPLNVEVQEITNKDNQTDIIKKLQDRKLYITMNIGSEKSNVKTYIVLSKNELYIAGKNVKNHKYDESASISYNCTDCSKINFNYAMYKEGIFSIESFNIKNGEGKEQTVNNISFILGVSSNWENPLEGEIGLHMPYPGSFKDYNFILNLKQANATKSYNWYLDFDNFSNGGGKLVVDGFPHELNEKLYKKEKFASIEAINSGYTYNWGIIFDSIYYNEQTFELSKDLKTSFEFDFGLISAPNNVAKTLENSFFNKYISKNICFRNYFGVYKESFIYCKNTKEFNPKEFQSIYFKSIKLEIIFELDYQDLFYYKDDFVYFLITFKEGESLWRLGEVFLKKYYIVFNQDSKTMGYYQGMEKEKERISESSFDIKYFFLIVILVLILVALIVVAILFYKKRGPRKTRANELDDDDFDYQAKNDENENKKISLIQPNIIN